MISIRRKFIQFILLVSLLISSWIGYYILRSSDGYYVEKVQKGGFAHALWTPKNQYAADVLLLVIDRAFWHKSVLTISGQGDMLRLYRISSDGKSLVPVNKK